MKLTRKNTLDPVISLVPMIDVMLILLVFFMVTSTYLNLDMIPFVDRDDQAGSPAETTAESTASATSLLLRISAEGQVFHRGHPMDQTAMSGLIKTRLLENPMMGIVILPSNQAKTQHLVSTLETLTLAGATRVRLMRLEGRK